MRLFYVTSLFVAALPAFAVSQSPLHELPIRLRIADGATQVAFLASADLVVAAGEQRIGLPYGSYALHLSGGKPARERIRLFSKTFQLGDGAARDAYLAEWRAKGYTPEVVVMGNRLEGGDGAVYDTRIEWIAMATAANQAEAKTLQGKIEKDGAWTWLRTERVAPGAGTGELNTIPNKNVGAWPLPFTVASNAPIAIANVDTGYWKSNVQTLRIPGRLSFEAGVDGKIEVFVEMTLDEYLKGILPAEMPSSWPMQALQAQAVAARSEVVASLGLRHHLDGFDFCMLEHCRAYKGETKDPSRTDQAIAATQDEILVREGKPVVTVFSSNCGGYTENNDTVWSAPPDLALRAVSDISKGNTSFTPESYGLLKWFTKPPPAYCSGDADGYRWRRRVSIAALNNVVQTQYGAGRVRSIELGERGPSGRLKSLRIVGSTKTVEVKKELPIRRLFGGLPSAAFVLDAQRGANGVEAYTITGAGRGHGVGMCQHGARGMADAGLGYTQILQHYFAGARVERCR